MKTNEGRRIVSDPKIRFGKPTIQGTRITVEDILRLTSRGLSVAEILEQYPHLTDRDVLAAHELQRTTSGTRSILVPRLPNSRALFGR